MINLPEFELYLFDLDDTLISTRGAYRAAQENAVTDVFSGPSRMTATYANTVRWFCQHIGSSQPELYFAAFLKSIDIPISDFEPTLSALLNAYHERYWNLLDPLPGAVQFLKLLANQGKPLALVSNGAVGVQNKKLKQCSLDRFFSSQNRFISENYNPSQKKPSPYMIEEATRTNHVGPDQTVFFGNAMVDILAGNLADVTTVAVGTWSSDINIPSLGKPDFQIKGWQ
jgi:FMN phosphatase YigB (HAD superfamily)